jgi:uncharacterized protein YndB with AHSA1/START domain
VNTNPDLDLHLERVIRAPRAKIWRAWTDPASFAQWWLPAPSVCRVDRLDVRPGGGLVTSMSDDGVSFEPHMDACFLVVDHLTRIVFTNVVDSQWRPNPTAGPVAMTAEIGLQEHPDGTHFRAVVRHGDPQARADHEKLGFFDGWGAVTAQLVQLVESDE